MRNHTLAMLMVMILAAMALPVSSFTITGQVNGSGSGPLSNALVEVTTAGGVLLNSTMTNASGFYDMGIENVAGLYLLNASALGFTEQMQPEFISSDVTVNFMLGPQPTVNVSGTVNNKTLGGVIVGALGGAHIRVETGGAVLVDVLSDADGNYIVPVLMNRSYNITGTLEGYTIDRR